MDFRIADTFTDSLASQFHVVQNEFKTNGNSRFGTCDCDQSCCRRGDEGVRNVIP